MFPFRSRKFQTSPELSTVESSKNDLAPEEFPEGSYGSTPTVALGKSTPWLEGQHAPNAFGYENKELHEGLERDYPGDFVPDDVSGTAPEME